MRARGKKAAHMRRVKDEGDEAFEDIPRIAMDSFFMTDTDMCDGKHPNFVMIDESTGLRKKALGKTESWTGW